MAGRQARANSGLTHGPAIRATAAARPASAVLKLVPSTVVTVSERCPDASQPDSVCDRSPTNATRSVNGGDACALATFSDVMIEAAIPGPTAFRVPQGLGATAPSASATSCDGVPDRPKGANRRSDCKCNSAHKSAGPNTESFQILAEAAGRWLFEPPLVCWRLST